MRWPEKFDLSSLTKVSDGYTAGLQIIILNIKGRHTHDKGVKQQWFLQTSNESKTEICIFSKNDIAPTRVNVNGTYELTQKTITVLGIIFDSKLTWAPQVSSTLAKSTKALNALRLVARFFNKKELIQLVTSNFYSILFYNSEVWYINNLKQPLKNAILSASARALRVCLKNYDWYVSFEDLHAMAKRATPEKLMLYKLSLQLFKIFNYSIPVTEWDLLNQNIIFTSRQTKFKTTKRNRLRMGMNTMSNRLWILNDKIPLDWLNLSLETFKIKMKSMFIPT